MQLTGPTTDPDLKMSPSIHAALIDSLFQDPGPLFAGAPCAGIVSLNVLCFLPIQHISTSLEKIFVRALIARERESAKANQFDTALNNMPHGLCMFRADGRLAVMNHRFSEMMNLPDDIVHRGIGAAGIVDACVRAGSISEASGTVILSEIASSRARDIITTDPDV